MDRPMERTTPKGEEGKAETGCWRGLEAFDAGTSPDKGSRFAVCGPILVRMAKDRLDIACDYHAHARHTGN